MPSWRIVTYFDLDYGYVKSDNIEENPDKVKGWQFLLEIIAIYQCRCGGRFISGRLTTMVRADLVWCMRRIRGSPFPEVVWALYWLVLPSLPTPTTDWASRRNFSASQMASRSNATV